MQHLSIAPLALLIPFLATRAPQDLSMHVETASSWTTELTLTSTLEFIELRVSMNGQEVPSEYLPQIDLEVKTEVRIFVHDHFTRVGDGRALELVREYEAIEYKSDSTISIDDGGDPPSEESTSTRGKSELEGRSVKLVWDDEDEEYGRTFADDSDGDEALLEALLPDSCWSVLLPDVDVEEGDSWEVPAESLVAIFFPGRDLSFEFDNEKNRNLGTEYYEQEMRGALTCVWGSTVKKGGDRHAVITIKGRLEHVGLTEGDLTRVSVAEGPATQEDIDRRQVEGELLWNLDKGILRSLELTSEVEHESMTTNDEGDMDYEGVFVTQSQAVLRVECRPTEE